MVFRYLHQSTNGKLVVWAGGLDSWDWKGLLVSGTPGIPNHRAPNHRAFTISWIRSKAPSTMVTGSGQGWQKRPNPKPLCCHLPGHPTDRTLLWDNPGGVFVAPQHVLQKFGGPFLLLYITRGFNEKRHVFFENQALLNSSFVPRNIHRNHCLMEAIGCRNWTTKLFLSLTYLRLLGGSSQWVSG